LEQQQLRTIGRYTLLARLGRGGMGDVYLAVVRGPGAFSKLLVVKALLPELADKERFVQMFLDEARLGALLHHTNVVQTFEVGQEGSTPFLVMEYLQGRSMDDLLAKRAEGELSQDFFVRLVLDALAGLHYAHELCALDGKPLDLVHRDISPPNIFVTYEGVVKLLDFGIAKAAGATTLTEPGVVKGKYAYMAPEQARGDAVDRRADIFAVGVVLWEILAGQRINEECSQAQQISKRISGADPSIDERAPDAPEALREICSKAMAFEAKDRYQTAEQMRQALEGYLSDHGPLLSTTRVGEAVNTLFSKQRKKSWQLIERQLKLAQQTEAAIPLLDMSSEHTSTSLTSMPTAMEGQGAQTTPTLHQKRGNRLRLAMFGLVVVGVACAVTFAFLLPEAKPRAAASIDAGVAPKAQADSAAISHQPKQVVDQRAVQKPDLAAHIRVTITVSPASAEILLDGKSLGRGRFSGSMRADDKRHELQVKAKDHVTKRRRLRFRGDVVVDLALTRKARRYVRPTKKPGKNPDKKKPTIDEDNPYK
jgi:serine/threonine protein kinase